jgi:hypothetical protein
VPNAALFLYVVIIGSNSTIGSSTVAASELVPLDNLELKGLPSKG